METVFKKNEDIFLPKDAVSPLGGLMPAVYQEVVRQGPSTVPWGVPAAGQHGDPGHRGVTWWLPSPAPPTAMQ